MDEPISPDSDSDPTPDDLDSLEETAAGKPLIVSAAEGLARMQRDLARLESDLNLIQDKDSILAKATLREIRDTRLRLLEYQHQLRDYCDSNLAMSEAIEKLTGLSDHEVCDLVCDSDDETPAHIHAHKLWDEGWYIAKRNLFSLTPKLPTELL